MHNELSRRELMKRALLASAAPALALIGREARADGLTLLDANNPTAQALGFVTDASKVEAASNPTFKTGQHCASCAQFQGKPSDSSAGCTIFSGHSVPAGGWCRVWSQRAG